MNLVATITGRLVGTPTTTQNGAKLLIDARIGYLVTVFSKDASPLYSSILRCECRPDAITPR